MLVSFRLVIDPFDRNNRYFDIQHVMNEGVVVGSRCTPEPFSKRVLMNVTSSVCIDFTLIINQFVSELFVL